jgi:hypothetical protein
VILAPLSKVYTGSTNASGKAAAATFIFLHSFVYSVFMFGTVYVYTTELFSTSLRAPGTAICTFLGQATSIIFQQIGLQAYEKIGYRFYFVFIACTAFAMVVYYLLLPETKGKTLEEIGAFFGDLVVAGSEGSKEVVDQVFIEVAEDPEGQE